VGAQLIVAVVVEALDVQRENDPPDRFLIFMAPRVVGFCQPVLDAARHCPRTNGGQWLALADHVEAHWPGIDGVPVPGLLGELDAPRHCLSDQWRSNGLIG
jgi:hypothetical protein